MWLLYLFLQKGKAYENKREILIDKMCNFFQAHNELKVILAEICPSPSTSPKIFDLRVLWDKVILNLLNKISLKLTASDPLYNNDKYRPPFRRGHKRELADPTIEIDLIEIKSSILDRTMIGRRELTSGGWTKGWGTIESRRRSNPSASSPYLTIVLGGGRRGWSWNSFCKIPTVARTRVENALAAASPRLSPFQLSNWKWRGDPRSSHLDPWPIHRLPFVFLRPLGLRS